MSRLSVGARVTIAMTLIAIAAVLVSVWLASRAVDSSLADLASHRVASEQVAGPALAPPAPSLAQEDRFIDHRLDGVRWRGVGLALGFALISAGLMSITLVRP